MLGASLIAFNPIPQQLFPNLTGGTISEAIATDGNTYRLHTFTTNDTLTVVSLGDTTSSLNKINFILIAGGGGGGSGPFDGGGGGAGGYSSVRNFDTPAIGSYPVVIGQGGAANTNGGNSSWNGITVYGGGAGTVTTGNNSNGYGVTGISSYPERQGSGGGAGLISPGNSSFHAKAGGLGYYSGGNSNRWISSAGQAASGGGGGGAGVGQYYTSNSDGGLGVSYLIPELPQYETTPLITVTGGGGNGQGAAQGKSGAGTVGPGTGSSGLASDGIGYRNGFSCSLYPGGGGGGGLTTSATGTQLATGGSGANGILLVWYRIL